MKSQTVSFCFLIEIMFYDAETNMSWSVLKVCQTFVFNIRADSSTVSDFALSYG
jgi:hypothetical protein